jgi:septal ring factor EnvC (AmiA/AmiB activator)
LIKRKAHNHRTTTHGGDSGVSGSKKTSAAAASAFPAAAASSVGGGAHPDPHGLLSTHIDGVFGPDTFQQKTLKTDLERRIREIEKQQNRIKDLEASQAKIVRENIQLSQLLNETRSKQQLMNDKMEKILKLLYCMYTKTPLSRVLNPSDGSGSGTIGSRVSNMPEGSFSDICNFLQLEVPFAKKNGGYG